MPRFSYNSNEHLATACPQLQEIFRAVIEHYDCTIIQGHRTEIEQNEYFRTGRSKVEFPNSKHNHMPSTAVDVAPYPIDWNDKDRFYHFAGYVEGVAKMKGYRTRWGGDWDRDHDFRDQTFMDLVHFEYLGAI